MKEGRKGGGGGFVLESVSRLEDERVDIRRYQSLGEPIAPDEKFISGNGHRRIQERQVAAEVIDGALLDLSHVWLRRGIVRRPRPRNKTDIQNEQNCRGDAREVAAKET